MIRCSSYHDVSGLLLGGAITIGSFDGVHLGHQALIARAIELSGQKRMGVFTFSPHPNEILKRVPHFYLTTDEQRVLHFLNLGVDVALLQSIDAQFLSITADDFITNMVAKALKVSHVVVGADFTFGRDAEGDVSKLTQLGMKLGFATHVMDDVVINHERCSSTAIRRYLSNGNVHDARMMLGRPYAIRHVVEHGQKLGADLGFRTANMNPPKGFSLRNGIYATVTRLTNEHGFTDYISATSVGVRPTVTNSGNVVVETHILDQDCALYGETIEVFFVEWLRDEIKFASTHALVGQIERDCDQIRALAQEKPELFVVEQR